MTLRITLAALAFLAAPRLSSAAEVPMQEGLWEINVTIQVPGLPFAPPPMTTQHCYTKEEIQKSGGIPEQQGDCKVTDLKKTGNKLTWKMVCTGQQPGSGDGEITFSSPTKYEGKLKMESSGTLVTSTYSGRRLGPCR
jgi:hypothetical protein